MDRDDPTNPATGASGRGARQRGDALDPWRDWPGARPDQSGQPQPPAAQPGAAADPSGHSPAAPAPAAEPAAEPAADPGHPLYPPPYGQSLYPPPYPLPYPPGYHGPGSAGEQTPPYPSPYPPGYPGPQMPGYPPGWAPPPERERGALGWWQWLLIAGVAVLLLCCGLSVAGGALRGLAYRSPGNGSVPSGLAQSGVGDDMVLGSDYAVTGNDFTIVNQTGHFGAGDSLALVVNLNGQPFGTTSMLLQVIRVEAGGGETVVRSVAETISSPDYSELAIKWLIARALMGNNPPGVYKLALTDSPSILAQASFYYTG